MSASINPPRWTTERLNSDLERARDIFRAERIQEPLDSYVEEFEKYQGSFENLLETTIDLTQLDESALDILTDPKLLEAFRYLAGPPLSEDDLKTISESVLSPKRLRSDPEMVKRILGVVKQALDRRRFPWATEGREANEEEKAAAILASAALMATSRVSAMRRNDGKRAQEQSVRESLIGAKFSEVPARKVSTLSQAPKPGEFCGESSLGGRKADFLVGLWDNRIMALECKVSNSALNSVKRLNNDAAAKAEHWIRDFGTLQIVPTAILSGVFKVHNLESAQSRGLTLFWAHNLEEMIKWIATTKSKG